MTAQEREDAAVRRALATSQPLTQEQLARIRRLLLAQRRAA